MEAEGTNGETSKCRCFHVSRTVVNLQAGDGTALSMTRQERTHHGDSPPHCEPQSPPVFHLTPVDPSSSHVPFGFLGQAIV